MRAASAGAGSSRPPAAFHPNGNRHIKRAGEAGSRLRASGAGRGRQAAPVAPGARGRIREGARVARISDAAAGR